MKRRQFLQTGVAATAALRAQVQSGRKKIAAVCTTYFVRSHADDIITRFLQGYWINDQFYEPPFDVVSLYIAQIHPADIGVRLAQAHNVPVAKSISDALTLGTGKLAVDAVVMVAEHGDYPFNDKMQQLYPRYEFFEQIVNVFKKSGRAVPVYTDKHLSYDWDKAKQMVGWSREFGFPMMAGSSVSVTFRRPEIDYPRGVEFADALAVGSGWVTDGGIFHNLEVLQCFLERRKGGETGIRSVQYLVDNAVWKAAEDGLWSRELMNAALARADRPGKGRPEDVKHPVLCSIEYNDGTRGAVLCLGGLVNDYLAAFRLKGRREIDSTCCYIPAENSNNFSNLVHGIVRMFETGKSTYPIERTLLTTGADAFLMESAYQGYKKIETPGLKVAYTAPEHSFYGHGRGS
jgi:hypothetical protein